MVALLLTAIVLAFATPRLQEQVAAKQLDVIARKFIMHANFARNQSLHIGGAVRIMPRDDQDWNHGWLVTSGCVSQHASSGCQSHYWLSQEALFPIYFKNQAFIDPHSQQKGIQFNAAGAAKTTQGGFIANRIIVGHRHYPKMERQLILGSGGRWRICNPDWDKRGCRT